MDYGKSFTYVFEDENWITKFLIGVVVSFIPIINLAGYGYIIEVVKNVRDGSPDPLPEWDEFGKFFMDGLKFMLGVLVYMIPVILATLAFIPFGVVGGEEPGAIIGMSMVALSCLIAVLAFLPVVLAPALMVQYAERDQIADMFAFADMWEMIKDNTGTYIVLLIMFFVVLSFIGSLGFIACGIGAVVTSWYAYLAGGHMNGQFAGLQPGYEKEPK